MNIQSYVSGYSIDLKRSLYAWYFIVFVMENAYCQVNEVDLYKNWQVQGKMLWLVGSKLGNIYDLLRVFVERTIDRCSRRILGKSAFILDRLVAEFGLFRFF